MKGWQRSLLIFLWVVGIPVLGASWQAYTAAQQHERNATATERLKAAIYHSPAIEATSTIEPDSTTEATTSSNESAATLLATHTTRDFLPELRNNPVETPAQTFDFGRWMANENFRREQQQKMDAAQQQRFDDGLEQQRRKQKEFQATLAEQTRKQKEFEADLAHSAARNAEWQATIDRSSDRHKADVLAQQRDTDAQRSTQAARDREYQTKHKY